MTKVTYSPQESGDDIKTEFAGIKFMANQPVDVPDDATINVLERIETRNAEGLPRGTSIEKKAKVVDVLKNNPYFVIEGQSPPKKKAGRPPVPKTPLDYRAHAQNWIANAKTHTEMEQRWANEEPLRDKIGIPEDGEDVRFIRTFYETKHHELKRAA